MGFCRYRSTKYGILFNGKSYLREQTQKNSEKPPHMNKMEMEPNV